MTTSDKPYKTTITVEVEIEHFTDPESVLRFITVDCLTMPAVTNVKINDAMSNYCLYGTPVDSVHPVAVDKVNNELHKRYNK